MKNMSLVNAMRAAGYTQKQLGQAISRCGSHISRVIHGTVLLTPEEKAAVAFLLSAPVETLFDNAGWAPEPPCYVLSKGALIDIQKERGQAVLRITYPEGAHD